MTNNKQVEPYIIRKQDKKSIDGLKCDLFRRLSLRKSYQGVIDAVNNNTELYAKAENIDFFMQIKIWIDQLDQEIYMGIKGYRFPLMIEVR